MTRAVRGFHRKHNGGIYGVCHHKDECSAISDHLRNHVHLTNCIHLRNHMHHHSPVMAKRSLMRDLLVLQRSRSLRDPSTSPPSWISPTIIGASSRRPLRDGSVHSGRRSLGVDQPREPGRLSVSSPLVGSVAASKVAAIEANGIYNAESNVKDTGLSKGKESISRQNHKGRLSTGSHNPSKDFIFHNAEARDEKLSQKGSCMHSVRLKTLSEQLEGVRSQAEIRRRKPSEASRHVRQLTECSPCEEPKDGNHSRSNGLNRRKRRKFKSARRTRVPNETRNNRIDKDQSVASNSLAQNCMHMRKHAEGGREEDTELVVTQASRNGCGIPWNWSRIHHRGKSFLDLAGRSLSCGLSDPRQRKAEATISQGQVDTLNIPNSSNPLSSSSNSDSELLPLLIEPPASQESNENPALAHDYSGELGIYANHSLRHQQDSFSNGRHRGLTQRYMPKTFKDLVGQNLVVQALSNAVLRRKVGLLYVFYGPHGTGKTSCARIFAKALNCQSAEHPKPCDVCKSCISHNLGKSKNVLEVGPVGNFDFEGVIDILDSTMLSPLLSQYKVFIFDDCDTLPPDSWSAISKVLDRARWHVVFILITSNLDHLPHLIISRCQKFFFPKLKDSDIIYALQWIATNEGLEIDKEALKLIASHSGGSLRDAEMTLDQLSLLGLRISLPLVQELVGLVSDEKLVDLLDLALSADTINTVKSLREIMEAGAEPLALMSQLATIITDILAGSYIFTQDRLRRRFFRRRTLSKEDMEKLRQALKTLSEAEKQLRTSNDKLTWLTAALLQLAPDHQYMLKSSQETSSNHSPMMLRNVSERNVHRHSVNAQDEMPIGVRGLSRATGREKSGMRNTDFVAQGNRKMHGNCNNGKKHMGPTHVQTQMLATESSKVNGRYSHGKKQENEQIWEAVLEKLQPDALRQFVSQEGKLFSVNLGAASTIQLMFNSHLSKSKAEKFRGQILQAFELVLSSTVILEIRCESRKYSGADSHASLVLPAFDNNSSSQKTMAQEPMLDYKNSDSEAGNSIRRLTDGSIVRGQGSTRSRLLFFESLDKENSQLRNGTDLSLECKHVKVTDDIVPLEEKGLESVCLEEGTSSPQQASFVPLSERREGVERRRQSLVKSRVSLAHVIEKAESCTQRGVWSRRKAVSIAEKLEQENLRLEPRSKSLLCWRVSRMPREKLRCWRVGTRNPRSLLRLVACEKCLPARSPR